MESSALTPAHARDICTWQYPAPYECYDMTAARPSELLDPAAGFHALMAGGDLVGFRSFGPDGRVPGWDYDDSGLNTGGGLRPSLTGRGWGRTAIETGLSYATEHLSPPGFRVTVAAFNRRAVHTVESLGFRGIAEFTSTHDSQPFLVLTRPPVRPHRPGRAHRSHRRPVHPAPRRLIELV